MYKYKYIYYIRPWLIRQYNFNTLSHNGDHIITCRSIQYMDGVQSKIKKQKIQIKST
jgi:hypothetical protein